MLNLYAYFSLVYKNQAYKKLYFVFFICAREIKIKHFSGFAQIKFCKFEYWSAWSFRNWEIKHIKTKFLLILLRGLRTYACRRKQAKKQSTFPVAYA